MGLRDNASKAVIWASVGFVSTSAISFVTSVVTARLLAPEIFGLVTLVLVIVSASHIFADAGTRAAVVQLEEPMEDVVSTALLSVPLQGLIGSIVIGLLVSLFCFPLGILTAVYLEEYAPDGKVTRIININIRNFFHYHLHIPLFFKYCPEW